MPLNAEITNCLLSYYDTLERILKSIRHSVDVNNKRNESPIILQVQDLLSIDAELKRYLGSMDIWTEKQRTIKSLEDELKRLSKEVNNFASQLTQYQMKLNSKLSIARKYQKSLEKESPTIADVSELALNIAQHSPGAKILENGSVEGVYAPDEEKLANTSFMQNDEEEDYVPVVESKTGTFRDLSLKHKADAGVIDASDEEESEDEG